MGEFNLRDIWNEMPEVIKVTLICISLMIGAMVIGYTVYWWGNYSHDNKVEEVAEVQTGFEIDITPNSTE